MLSFNNQPQSFMMQQNGQNQQYPPQSPVLNQQVQVDQHQSPMMNLRSQMEYNQQNTFYDNMNQQNDFIKQNAMSFNTGTPKTFGNTATPRTFGPPSFESNTQYQPVQLILQDFNQADQQQLQQQQPQQEYFQQQSQNQLWNQLQQQQQQNQQQGYNSFMNQLQTINQEQQMNGMNVDQLINNMQNEEYANKSLCSQDQKQAFQQSLFSQPFYPQKMQQQQVQQTQQQYQGFSPLQIQSILFVIVFIMQKVPKENPNQLLFEQNNYSNQGSPYIGNNIGSNQGSPYLGNNDLFTTTPNPVRQNILTPNPIRHNNHNNKKQYSRTPFPVKKSRFASYKYLDEHPQQQQQQPQQPPSLNNVQYTNQVVQNSFNPQQQQYPQQQQQQQYQQQQQQQLQRIQQPFQPSQRQSTQKPWRQQRNQLKIYNQPLDNKPIKTPHPKIIRQLRDNRKNLNRFYTPQYPKKQRLFSDEDESPIPILQELKKFHKKSKDEYWINEKEFVKIVNSLKESIINYFFLNSLDKLLNYFSDQKGSRQLQCFFENAKGKEKEKIYFKIQPLVLELMNNNFGNFAVQKILENGTKKIQYSLFEILRQEIHYLSLQAFGCRVVQMSIEIFNKDDERIDQILNELKPNIKMYLKDKNANHVLQKCLECIHHQKLTFIFDIIIKNGETIMSDTYACRVVQKVLANVPVKKVKPIIQSLLINLDDFFTSNFSNHIVQYILTNNLKEERDIIYDIVTKNFTLFSKNKCGRYLFQIFIFLLCLISHIVEKCIVHGDKYFIDLMVNLLLKDINNNNAKRFATIYLLCQFQKFYSISIDNRQIWKLRDIEAILKLRKRTSTHDVQFSFKV